MVTVEMERSGQIWRILESRTCRHPGSGDRGIEDVLHLAYVTGEEALPFTELRNL